MSKIFGLTEKDRDDLRQLFTEWNNTPGNPANRAPAVTHDYPSTGAYIAYAPLGIDAAEEVSETGTGTAVYLAPGAALCDIYRLLNLNGIPTLYPLGINSQMVFNISDAALAVGSWLLILQDKFNTWYATTGGGSEPLHPGDVIEKVVPETALGPSPGSGTGSIDDDTYLWTGYLCNIGLGPIGEVIPISAPDSVYILQRTQVAPEPDRLLKISGTYSAHFNGIADLGYGMKFVYVVLAAPVAVTLKQVVTDIISVSTVCNGDKTITTVIGYTTEEILTPG